MPIPKPETAWPPTFYEPAMDSMAECAAWWVGTDDRFQNYYRAGQQPVPRGNRGFGAKARDFFSSESGRGGTKPSSGASSRVLHLPLAADIVRLKATLLYGNPPLFLPSGEEQTIPQEADPITGEMPDKEPETIIVRDEATTDRLDELANDDRTQASFMAHEESVSALGGGCLRVVWDVEAQPDGPFLEHVDADMCIPDFSRGRLAGILFFTEYPDGDTIWRHFEYYGRGYIEHALFEGTKDNVGRPVSFDEHPATEWLLDTDADGMPLLNENSQIETGHDGIAARYVPNRRPYPKFRRNPRLRMLGAPDLSDDVLPLMAAIDEVWSSLMRDVRHGASRLVVSDSLLETISQGRGQYLDANAEYIQRVTGGATGDDEKPVIEQVQFEIRQDQHLAIITALLKEILRRVGISPMDFGIVDQVATTATEVKAWRADTVATVTAARRLATPELSDLMEALLDIDAEFFDGPGLPDGVTVDVEWPAVIEVSDQEKGQTLTLLTQAEAMSTYEKVKYLHPDWTDTQIQAEVDKIDGAKAAATPVDPFGFTEPPAPTENDQAAASTDPNANQ